ncbi:MAG: diguanylate cyclase [Acidobacteria bacterium]|nr:diguanylate cyclase [Acidobacteriota bacterium]MCL5288392.1 diguanylate cyclase [Acidobacteriota bacterium]
MVKTEKPNKAAAATWEELQARLRQLERRDWWLWSASVVVMLLLTAAVVALALPTLLNWDAGEQFALIDLTISQGVRGLIGLVLLFNTYSIYQQILIKRLRRNLAEQISVSADSQLRADELHLQLLEKQKRDRALAQSIDTLSIIVDATKQLNSTLDLGELIQIVLELATKQTGADRGTMFLVDKVRQEIWSLVGLGLEQHAIRIPMSSGIAGYVARTGETINLENAYDDPRFEEEVDRKLGYRTRTLLCLPILNKDNDVVGVLQLLNKTPGPFNEEDTNFLRALSVHCAIAIENATLHQLAMHDPLTGLYNRRFIEENMAVEFARSERREYALTLLIIDLNNFKEINDRHGHAAGDQVLRAFAEQLKKACRGCDLPARIGGDEFMLLLPECLPGQAPVVLARLSGLQVEFGGAKIPVTFAAGWAEHRAGEKPAELLERADKNLYMEKRTGKMEEGIRQAQRLQTVGQLTGGIAHDLSNLLMVIKSYSELALDEQGLDEKLHKNLLEIQKASDRATALTRQMLAFSRKQALLPENLCLNTEIGDAKSLLARLLPENIRVETKLDPSLGRTRADRTQIEQIILNLAVNARDAMPQGGTMTIETSNAELDEAYTRTHNGARVGAYVLLRVRDTGCGMNEETRARVFEPFFTTKEIGKGTGLGLATVYGIVKQSAGYIWADSELGKGSTFSVYLPRIAN